MIRQHKKMILLTSMITLFSDFHRLTIVEAIAGFDGNPLGNR